MRRFELQGRPADAETIRQAVSTCSVVFDLVGSSGAVSSNRSPLENLDNNCRIQLEFLEACALAGSKPHIVFSSSRLVYGQTGSQPVAEDHPVAPQSIYAAHKLCIENYLQIYASLGHITYTTCRISNVYGFDTGPKGQGYRVVNAFIRQGLAGKSITLFGDGSQLRDYIYIADLVEALMRCGTLPSARNELLNIGAGASVTMRDTASLIRKLTGGPPVHFAPWPQDYGTVESGDFVANIEKAKSLIGLSCKYDLAAGLAETVAQYRRLESAAAGAQDAIRIYGTGA